MTFYPKYSDIFILTIFVLKCKKVKSTTCTYVKKTAGCVANSEDPCYDAAFCDCQCLLRPLSEYIVIWKTTVLLLRFMQCEYIKTFVRL